MLPHDLVITQGAAFDQNENQKHGYLPRGVGWYKRTVEVPAITVGGSAWLHFEGAYRDTDVYIDGEHVLHHLSGRSKSP